MKIYWHATAPWSPSSYSILTARTVPNIVRAGYDLTIGVWYGLQGRPLPWHVQNGDGKMKEITILPHHQVNGNVYGQQTMQANYEFTKADCLVTVCDVFVFPPSLTHMMNFCPWLPIDTDPAPAAIVECLEPAIYPMVYSKWGTEVLQAAGVDAHYVPCSAPADVYTPGDKAEARKLFHVERDYDYLVTMVAANKDQFDRKGFSEALQAFAKFVEKHEDSMLYIHTDWGGPINIAAMAARLGIEKHIIQPDQFAYINGLLNEQYMRDVYRASDLLLNPCKSEGFGLPLVEAQMCGCPIAAADFATTDELLGAGWKIDGQLDWYAGPDAWRYRCYVDSIVDSLEAAYKERNNRKLRKKARQQLQRYDNDIIFNRYWKPALKAIDDMVSNPSVQLPVWESKKVTV